MRNLGLLLGLFLTFNVFANDQGIVFGQGTRIVFNLDNHATKLNITNYTKTNFLVQATIHRDDDARTLSSDFMVTPELFKVQANTTKSVAIRRVDGKLPEDRESLVYVVGKFFPQKETNHDAEVELLYSFTQKVFLRPTCLKSEDGVGDSLNKVEYWYENGSLYVENKSPYYLTFFQIFIDGKKYDIPKSVRMLSPFSKNDLKYKVKPKEIKWSFISDSGYETAQSERIIR